MDPSNASMTSPSPFLDLYQTDMLSIIEGLDTLPMTALDIISKFIAASSKPHHTALLFSKDSEVRRGAVIEALEFRVIFREQERAIFQDLIRLFGDTIREVSLVGVVDDFFLIRMPYLPYLRKASILVREKQLLLIKDSPNLANLEIKVDRIEDLLWLPPVFDSLTSLTSLTLHLPERISPDLEVLEVLAASCPNVTNLNMHGRNVCHRYVDMTKNLHSLQHLSYSGSLGMEFFIDLLPFVKEVHLLEEQSMAFAEWWGHALRTLFISHVQNASDISKLEQCPNLQKLLVPVEEGAERALVGITKNLESLDIRWGYSFCIYEEAVGDLIYYEPHGDVLLDLVEGSPKLRHLLLERAMVPTTLIENIFTVIGDRLVQFGVHMTGQDECVASRLERILKSMSRGCPNIKCLALMGMDKEIYATHEQIHRCHLALSKARIKCPKLEIDKICSHINKIIPLPSKRKRSGNQKYIEAAAILD